MLRMIEQEYKLNEKYSFDRKQKAAAQTLREIIDAKEIDDDMMKEMIYQLELALFYKK